MLVERGIYWYRVAEGSIDQTLSEKMCSRSVRVVKLIYEALSCMLLDKFIENMWRRICSRFQSERGRYTCILTKDLREDELNEVIEKETFKSFNKNYVDFIDNMKDSDGELAVYWLSFAEMTQVLLNIIFETLVI